jgi:hypothetical protein
MRAARKRHTGFVLKSDVAVTISPDGNIDGA